jgi:hypothetical protein
MRPAAWSIRSATGPPVRPVRLAGGAKPGIACLNSFDLKDGPAVRPGPGGQPGRFPAVLTGASQLARAPILIRVRIGRSAPGVACDCVGGRISLLMARQHLSARLRGRRPERHRAISIVLAVGVAGLALAACSSSSPAAAPRTAAATAPRPAHPAPIATTTSGRRAFRAAADETPQRRTAARARRAACALCRWWVATVGSRALGPALALDLRGDASPTGADADRPSTSSHGCRRNCGSSCATWVSVAVARTCGSPIAIVELLANQVMPR